MSLLEFELSVFVEFLVRKLVEPHVPDVRRLVVGCSAAKAEK